MMVVPDNFLVLGKIAGVYGVQGWVKLFSHTSPRENILKYASFYLYHDNQWVETQLLKGAVKGKHVVAYIEGISDREHAHAMIGSTIAVEQERLDKLDDSEVYWKDLEGLRVVTTDDVELGHIQWLFNAGSNDVMIVKGERERYLPWTVNDVVQRVDLAEGLVVVDWDPEF